MKKIHCSRPSKIPQQAPSTPSGPGFLGYFQNWPAAMNDLIALRQLMALRTAETGFDKCLRAKAGIAPCNPQCKMNRGYND